MGEYLGELGPVLRSRVGGVDSQRRVAALAAPLDVRLRDHVRDRYSWRRAAERTLAVYEAVMTERDTEAGGEWRAALTPEQYIEHLESLVQLQLETIALRDGHYANAREQAERAVEYAQSLEAERARLEAELAAVRNDRRRVTRRFRR